MKTLLDWIIRLGLAALFFMAGGLKLMSDPQSVDLFTRLGMEPGGRLVIGVLEVVSAVMVLLPATVARGALLAFWILLGAFIAHASQLGFDGQMSVMWAFGFGTTCVLLGLHHREIPFLAQAFEKE